MLGGVLRMVIGEWLDVLLEKAAYLAFDVDV
jgi:hypothetical protein